MRSQRLILLTLLVTIAVGICFLSSDRNVANNSEMSVSVAFKDRDAGPPFGARGFDLTNSGLKSILLTRVWVQKWENGHWANSIVKFSTVLPFGQTNIEAYNPIFEPGECRRLVAEWPSNGPWRIELQYAVEMNSI